jgi:hypothetical protein
MKKTKTINAPIDWQLTKKSVTFKSIRDFDLSEDSFRSEIQEESEPEEL